VIQLMDDAGDLAGKAEAVNNIASVHLALMDWDEALTRATEAREFYQEAEDRAGEAVVLSNIGAAHDGMGDWQQAVAIYGEALEIRQSLGDLEGEAKALRNLAILFAQHGNRTKAKSYLNRALGAARRAKSRQVLAEIRKTMSQLPRMRRR
jgi:tetratricopeptide (TPR) repeat protein